MKRIKIKLRPTTEQTFHVTVGRLEDNEAVLPFIPEALESALEEWRSTYRQLEDVRKLSSSSETNMRLGSPSVTTISDYEDANRVKAQLNKWLSSTDSHWVSLQEHLVSIVTKLKKDNECIPVLIDVEDIQLRRLPWQEWKLFDNFNWRAEFVLRVKSEGDEEIQSPRKQRKVKILVVVGRSDGIRTQDDLAIIKNLKKKNAEIKPLIQPTIKELCDELLKEKYHIFIFTGHSRSLPDGQIGWIDVNNEESLSIDKLKGQLKTAIENGLQLAIFNSCDGLGLANELAKLNLPRCIVMREPVPDEVAVEFLKRFFEKFTENKSLFESVYEARKYLEYYHIPRTNERFYPGIMWLPTICIRQSALDQPFTWQEMLKKPLIDRSLLTSQLPNLATGFVAGGLVTGIFAYYLTRTTLCNLQQQPIRIDGSSTVFPITNEVAQEYPLNLSGENKPEIPVHFSGTVSGFRKFCQGETDINNASRPILKTEIELCKANGVDYVELPVAYDLLTVIVNSSNLWINSITTNELKKIWEPQAERKVTKWSQVRVGLPDRPINLYSPGFESGTYDYFTTTVVGQERKSRRDFHVVREDDEVLVRGVSRDVSALGYVGYSYYVKNSSQLKALAIDNGYGAIKPSIEQNQSYPLTRPLFIYVNAKSATARAEIRDFVKYYISNAKTFVKKVGYVPFSDQLYSKILDRFERNEIGTMFVGKIPTNSRIEELLQKKS